ncbi:hypothetical protein J6590_045222 [Homalodisca vitripennis]|nr:hypothetical protein J6590_045222 [Homalodisca vitripennis]
MSDDHINHEWTTDGDHVDTKPLIQREDLVIAASICRASSLVKPPAQRRLHIHGGVTSNKSYWSVCTETVKLVVVPTTGYSTLIA